MRRSAIVALLGLFLAACGSGGGTGSTSSPTPSSSPSTLTSSATLTVVSPKPGELVDGPDVTVRVTLTGATLLEPDVLEVRPDAGHIHVMLDGETVSQLGKFEYVMKDVSVGAHVLSVEFVAGNHLPFYPRIQRTVTFRVR